MSPLWVCAPEIREESGDGFSLPNDVWRPNKIAGGAENIKGLFNHHVVPLCYLSTMEASRQPDSFPVSSGLSRFGSQEKRPKKELVLPPEVTRSHFPYVVFSWSIYKDLPRFKAREQRSHFSVEGILNMFFYTLRSWDRIIRMGWNAYWVSHIWKKSVCYTMSVSYKWTYKKG